MTDGVAVEAAAPSASPTARAADPAERGTLRLADRVVEKVAARAATEVERTVDVARRLTERLPGRSGSGARAEATVSGRLVQLRVRIAIEYPVPVARVTREVRRHVRDVVGRLCDVEVRDVDVEVTALRRPEQGRRVQ